MGHPVKGNGPHKSYQTHHQLQVQGLPNPLFDSMFCQSIHRTHHCYAHSDNLLQEVQREDSDAPGGARGVEAESQPDAGLLCLCSSWSQDGWQHEQSIDHQDAPLASESREFTGLGPVDMIDD